MSDFIPAKARELMGPLELIAEEREFLLPLKRSIERLSDLRGYPTRPVRGFLEKLSDPLRTEKAEGFAAKQERAFRKLGNEEELEAVASAGILVRHLSTKAEAQRRGENVYGYLASVLRGELTAPMRSSWLQAVNSAGGDETLAFLELDQIMASRLS